MDDVLRVALVKKPEPIEWDEAAAAKAAAVQDDKDAGTRVTAH